MIKDIYLENLLTEDGHEDVPSAIRKLKTSIEDCQEIIQKLESVGDIELPTWWMGKVIESSDRLNKARDYILNSELTEAPLNSPSQLPFSSTLTSPFSNEPWIKFPHPLTYTALLKSPFDLTPVENPKEGEEYLLFYVNLMTLDYVEAIIPGDFVKATKDMDSIETILGKRNIAQNGFVYSRRAEQNEGFKIREGCG